MMKLIRAVSMRSRAIAIVLTVGSLCWVAAAQQSGPAKELLQWVSDAPKRPEERSSRSRPARPRQDGRRAR